MLVCVWVKAHIYVWGCVKGVCMAMYLYECVRGYLHGYVCARYECTFVCAWICVKMGVCSGFVLILPVL